eukprot:TRINITY_DN5342_c0_g1_i1.p1 TRINITY_DN5342_c0_g1~~TRINITY_DN5342_c0_g1_i1.p1  ORF type:complete len:558 (+),score=72.30 TRINITY_DN5342_c0_g1_i1:442-2115(+)
MPVIVELQFTWQYLNGSRMPPKVLSVVQTAHKDLNAKVLTNTKSFGLQWYLSNRLSDVLRRNWVKYYRGEASNDFKIIPLTAQKTFSAGATPKKEAPTPSSKNAKKGDDPVVTTKFTKEAYQLMDMGFEYSVLCHVLNYTKGNVDQAVNYLMDPGKVNEIVDEALDTQKKGKRDLKKSAEVGFGRMQSTEIERLENFFDGPNFLLKVIDYLNLRLKTCASSCIICDAPLGFVGVKPTVCPNLLCTHSFDAYGLGFSLTSELAHNADVIDLLVSITVSAARNRRHNGADVFDPYPDSVQIITKDKWGRDEQTLSFRKGQTKDFDLVAQVCDALPSIAELAKFSDEAILKSYLDSMEPLAYPLLRWILMSNRAHLAPLPKNKHINMGTPYQFVLISDNPQKEASFRRLREANAKRKGKRGSFYAFHGSAIGNWHCIFRSGLKNYSNTDKMSAGAACGPGIYMAADAATSLGYMSPGVSWQKSKMANGGGSLNMACIALCEVIDYRGENKGVNVHGGIYTVTDETLVVTRYFFIFPQGSSSYGSSLLADKLTLPEDIYNK